MNKVPSKKNIVKLPVRKAPKEKGLIEEGSIGDLKYKLFDRGNIQITDGVSVFRKDCDEFKKALSKKDFENIKDNGSFEIPGAGDTDPLVIFKDNGEFKLRLGGKIPPIVLQLRKILNRA